MNTRCPHCQFSVWWTDDDGNHQPATDEQLTYHIENVCPIARANRNRPTN